MTRTLAVARAAALAAILAGCKGVTAPGSGNVPAALDELPRALTASEQRVITGSNAFAFGLLRETARADTAANVFLSPLSASMALGMAMNGARGETLSQMQATLGFGGLALEEADRSYRSLIDLLRGLDSGVDMRLANSIWARSGFLFAQDFQDALGEYFDARATTLDFDDPTAAPTINDWVKQNTGGNIDRIVDAPIDPSLVMFLIDAVYFKGSWRNRFDPAETRDAPFHAAAGGTISVKMMHRTGDGSFFATPDGVSGVELPYSRGAYVMDVVLPPEGTPLGQLVATLDTARWDGWLAGLHTAELDLSMPRFRLEYEALLDEPLMRLGMTDAFSWPPADFTGMCVSRDDCYINFVKQKTYVDVNEEGTEAAAATSVGITPTSVRVPVRFVVERPFLVAIRERLSGSILFLGAIGAPESP